MNRSVLHASPFIALCLAHPGALGVVVTVLVSHNDPDGIVNPGQVVHIDAVLSWTSSANQFAGARGGLIASPNVGAGSAIQSAYVPGALVNLGQINGGSLVGLDIAQTPAFFTGGFMVPPSGQYLGFELVSYDWTAPTSGFEGEVLFDFVAHPNKPNIEFFGSGPLWVPPMTTWIGTSLTVVPTPPTIGAFGILALARHRRR